MKKIILITFFLLTSSNLIVAQTPSYVPTEGLMGWWSFSGNANDESLNGNNGIVSDATPTTDRFGNLDNAYNFDGVTSSIDFGNSINILNDFTISFWINTSQETTGGWQSGYGMILSKEDASGVPDWSIGVSDGKIKYKKGSNTSIYYQLTCTPVINNLQWRHIVIKNSTTNISIFVDGIADIIGTHSELSFSNSNIKLIAGWYDEESFDGLSVYRYEGDLDDIGIWNRSLIQSEITDLYNSSLTTKQFSEKAIIATYPNPFMNQFSINNDKELIGTKYTIYDTIGKLVFTGTINSENAIINLENLSSGIYLLKIGNNIKQSIKVIKQ